VGRHPRHQLPQSEGLGHVVVCADLQGDDGVDLVGPRAHHDHRDGRVHLAKLAAYIEARGVGQGHLQQDDARPRMLDLAQRLRARLGLDDLVTVLLAHQLDLAAGRAVRLHDEDLARGLRHSHDSILTSLKDC